ncbi:DUF1524 domain-containing protein [Vibrio splendidus]
MARGNNIFYCEGCKETRTHRKQWGLIWDKWSCSYCTTKTKQFNSWLWMIKHFILFTFTFGLYQVYRLWGKKGLGIAVVIYALVLMLPNAKASGDIVKMSNSGICHPQESRSYNRTKSFKPYDTVEACLNDGGVLPKHLQGKYKTNTVKPTNYPKYSRSMFGGWKDFDKDCQNTRHEMLIANIEITPTLNIKGCMVTYGQWVSTYTGKTLTNPEKIDIDHVIPLKWAFTNGADTWSKELRVQFANDPDNLRVSAASVNRSKGAKGLTQWLPDSNKCEYIGNWWHLFNKYPFQLGETKLQALADITYKTCPQYFNQ